MGPYYLNFNIIAILIYSYDVHKNINICEYFSLLKVKIVTITAICNSVGYIRYVY